MGGRTVVMTGGTSGFGALAARRMRDAGARLLLGGRAAGAHPDVLPLELAARGSVRGFAEQVRERLGGRGIDALVLNAGVVLPNAATRTTDGLEVTFAVNHLAHYLLLRLLDGSLAEGAVVVLTTSGAHDPTTGAGLVPPRHARAELLAHPERDPGLDPRARAAGEHAYTASKLCVILTARQLARRCPSLRVIAFDPGQVFGTGLVRQLSFPRRAAWRVLGARALGHVRRLSATMNSPTAAGRALADLAMCTAEPPKRCAYAALRGERLTWSEPSDMARDDVLAHALWRDSAHLLGLRPESAA